MLISPNNCEFGSKFWIRPDEADPFLVNTHLKCIPGTRMEPWTPEPVNAYSFLLFYNLLSVLCELCGEILPISRFIPSMGRIESMHPFYSLQWHFIQTHLPESSVEIRAGCPFNCRCSCRIFDQYCLTSEQDSFLPRTFSASKCQRPHRVQAIILPADFSYLWIWTIQIAQKKKGT